MKPPIRIAIIGMGGFAGWHHNTVAKLEERGQAKLIATCDPQAGQFAAQQQALKFAERGVRVFQDYRTMLDACRGELDMLLVPTPIQLHAEMHKAGVEHGVPVYLEKPPTLDYAELEEMIARDRRSKKAALVGFNFIIEKPRLALKSRILAGEFGAVRGATLSALWPRPADYFRRNSWAGRLMMGDRVVLDSCFGNALAHFVHNILFWAGTGSLFSWAQIAKVRAELYRAHDIEGADTFFVEADTETGVSMRFALSHACAGPSSQTEIVICEKATIRYLIGQFAEIRWSDGRIEKIEIGPFDGITENHLEYYRFLRGEVDRPATMLADCRPFVTLNDLAHVSSGRITPIPPDFVRAVRDEKEQKDYFDVNAIGAMQENFLQRGVWPSAKGCGQPGEAVTPADLKRFHEVVRAMLNERKG